MLRSLKLVNLFGILYIDEHGHTNSGWKFFPMRKSVQVLLLIVNKKKNNLNTNKKLYLSTIINL